MSLHEYRRKRDFDRTNEPGPDRAGGRGHRAIFVVQLHHASTRHFDFRLQLGDALKSWAVPKGPSFDPAVKRLAVEVEDHPVPYADFEGDIEEGYGKGHVDIFDKGVWTSPGDVEAQLAKGHLTFELFGERLKGGWHLVRSSKRERQPAWFLIKADDAFASDLEADDLLDGRMRASTKRAGKGRAAVRRSTKTSRLPRKQGSWNALARELDVLDGARDAAPSARFLAPQLTRLRDAPPQGDGWIHEVKWDGYRLTATVVDGRVAVWSRNGLFWNERVPEIVQAIEALGLSSARFDGELVAFDAKGRSDFNALQKTLAGEGQAPLAYVMFDMPYLLGKDLAYVPLIQRKALLERVLEHAPAQLRYSSHHAGDGPAVFDQAIAHQLEGIISKRAEGIYDPGGRDDWLKIKRLESDEFAVVGFTRAKGSRLALGSLLLAKPGEGKRWNYVGRVGTGFSDDLLRELGRDFARKGHETPPVPLDGVDPLLQGEQWVKPAVVAEVFFRGYSGGGLLRQASLKALRFDKSPDDLQTTDAAEDTPMIAITHPERLVYPGDGITKQKVVDYYRAVMDWILPPIVDRPLSIVRCPDGIDGAMFFQKHALSGLKRAGLTRIAEKKGGHAEYLYPQDAEGLIELVQFGAVEFHPWGAHIADPDRADRIVFDLDPGDGVAWGRVVEAARTVRSLLDALGLVSFVRTSGGKGLHVVVPLKPASDWDTVKLFARGFAEAMAGTQPMEFVATATKSLRKGKIYIDYLRNGRGATAIASYSLRARAGAPVATPLRWDELGKLRSGSDFDIHSMPKRLARLKSDPWSAIDEVGQSMDDVGRRFHR